VQVSGRRSQVDCNRLPAPSTFDLGCGRSPLCTQRAVGDGGDGEAGVADGLKQEAVFATEVQSADAAAVSGMGTDSVDNYRPPESQS